MCSFPVSYRKLAVTLFREKNVTASPHPRDYLIEENIVRRDAWSENRWSLAVELMYVVTIARTNGKWGFRCGSVDAMHVSYYNNYGRRSFRDARQGFGSAGAITDTRVSGIR